MAVAPNPGADSEGASAGRASWESELAAHIRRYATYPANGSRDSGTVRVGVTIDRNGRLLSRRLAGSSGSSTLDSAAMTVIERAQPFPAFLRNESGPDRAHDSAAPQAAITGEGSSAACADFVLRRIGSTGARSRYGRPLAFSFWRSLLAILTTVL